MTLPAVIHTFVYSNQAVRLAVVWSGFRDTALVCTLLLTMCT